MTSSQKVSFSLLISIVLFSAFTILSFTGLFDIVETRFYNPSISRGIQGELQRDSAVIQKYLKDLGESFQFLLSDSSIKNSTRTDQAEEDILKRSRLLGLLTEEVRGLQYMRIIDSEGRHIHYSTHREDILRQDQYSVSYRNYGTREDDIPYPQISAADQGPPRFVLDAPGEKIIYILPFYDSFEVFKGSALFYISLRGLNEQLIREGRLKVGEELTPIEDPGGLLSGFPAKPDEALIKSIAATWKDGILGPTRLENAENNSAFMLISIQTEDGDLFIGRINNEALYAFPMIMKIILLSSFFITCFLTIFLLFNLQQDSVTVVRDRLKRLQISLLEEYYEKKIDIDWNRWSKDLEHRREEVRQELKQGIRHKLKKKTEQDIDDLIDKSWDELITALGVKPIQSLSSSIDEGKLQAILGRVLASGIQAQPLNTEDSPRQPKAPSSKAPSPPKVAVVAEEAEDLESLEEVEELVETVEELEEFEEFAEPEETAEIIEAEVAEESPELAAAAEKLPEAVVVTEEAEDLESLEEVEDLVETVEELEEIDEFAEPEETAEAVEEIPELGETAEVAEDVEELAEPEETAEAVEEIPELGKTTEAQEAAAEEIEEFGETAEDLEALEEVEELVETVEELEEVEEFAEPEETAEIIEAEVAEESPEAAATAEKLPEAVVVTEEAEDLESLEEVEELVETVEELEEVEEFAEPEEIAEAVEEIPELGETAEAQEAAAEEIEKFGETAEDLEALEEVEEYDEIAEVVEAEVAEDVEELAEPEEIAEAVEEIPKLGETAEAQEAAAEEMEKQEEVINLDFSRNTGEQEKYSQQSNELTSKNKYDVNQFETIAEATEQLDLDEFESLEDAEEEVIHLNLKKEAEKLEELKEVDTSWYDGHFEALQLNPQELEAVESSIEENMEELEEIDVPSDTIMNLIELAPVSDRALLFNPFTTQDSGYIPELEYLEGESEIAAVELLEIHEEKLIEEQDGVRYIARSVFEETETQQLDLDPQILYLTDEILKKRR